LQAHPGLVHFPAFYGQVVREANEGELLAEAGSWLGRRTVFLAEKLRASGKRVKVVVVDTIQG